MITVYQIALSNRDILEANSPKFRDPPKFVAYRNMLLSGHDKWRNEYAEYYIPVMEIDTDDLNEAFDVANGFGQSSYRRLTNCRSASVGDIFLKEGNCYIVDPMGFTNIGYYELGESNV